MSMNQPLTGCVMKGPKSITPDFAPIAASFLYQSEALGMNIAANENCADNEALCFEFETPHTAPVICEITRWEDPSRQATVSENIMQAACGLMSVHGRTHRQPKPLGLNYVSTLTAALALQGSIAATIGRLRGLPVSGSTVSMAAAALLSMSQYIAGATASESPETAETTRSLPGSSPACPPFVSLDGVFFELETLDAGPWQKFWTELGVSSAAAGKGWRAFLLRYARAASPLPDELPLAISKLTYHRISQICARTGMAICPVRSIDDRAQDDDARQIWQQGPWSFSSFSSEPKPNGEYLRPAGALPADDLPLSGFTVIESCRRIQGPLAGHLLALLGATVIRIEPPGGDALRGMPPMAEGCSARFQALNRLKTVREIDIKSAAGKTEIRELARHADVFLHNWAPGKAVLLNLDHGDLGAINPSLVYAYAGGWATDCAEHVSSNSMPGTDFMAQAYSGVAGKIAGAGSSRGGSLFTVLDVLGGVVAAQGITIALLNRCMNNVGAKVTSSLMSAATLLCAEDFRDIYSLPASGSKPSTSIINEVNDVYATRQGRIAVECPDVDTVLRLAEVLDITAGIENKDFQRCLSEVFPLRTADEWVELFQHAGIPAAVVIEDLAELQTLAHLQPGLIPGSYTQVNSPWRFK
ncbi:CoA transferase [Nitrosospira multiformis]|uniref:Crotonobetainyl-CoA:carnitine CoA-transferase CaiB n=1 Tax=Nitrosospira multiformis TaxID=1231 RepID=A0A1I7G316_9PROT|nr:CoA transferase [Nitrosospira multiformis]SFU42838.1 Crotonobetainyl-CoA:carnitine CoA-transferase CaiB [Nitrosospira multiformis]